jgi:hypothetical protein
MDAFSRYTSTLTTMFLIENIGESIYKALGAKTADPGMASVYARLSLNESTTAANIAAEMQRLGLSLPTTRNAILRPFAARVFAMLSHDRLESLLKRALRRRKFRSWFDRYHHHNEVFWRHMLEHEILQYELLRL